MNVVDVVKSVLKVMRRLIVLIVVSYVKVVCDFVVIMWSMRNRISSVMNVLVE